MRRSAFNDKPAGVGVLPLARLPSAEALVQAPDLTQRPTLAHLAHRSPLRLRRELVSQPVYLS